MITFSLALLLAAGLGAAKICQWLRLPSVTGYIIAGLLLGPTGIDFINEGTIGHSLDHFVHIALMLIAFGIGEHIEIKKIAPHARSLMWIGVCETTGAFLLVSIAIFLTIHFTGFVVAAWELKDYIALSLLLGAVSVATAPAATLLVIRELRAQGPLTSTLMAIVAIDDGLAIIIFGLAISATHQIIGHSSEHFVVALSAGLLEICQSLILGIITGYLLHIVVSKLRSTGEIMTGGLAILLLCSETAIYLHLSPLLAGMAAGFILINKAERDVRVFRALNSFEPPIYVLFFTLAGMHLDIKTLKAAGILGLVYFIARITGKITGVALGARLGNSIKVVQNYLGFALVPQAGVAIGLIFLISSDKSLAVYSSIITPVVLAGVFFSELIGPLSARFAVTQAGEAGSFVDNDSNQRRNILPLNGGEELPNNSPPPFRLIPWSWQTLLPHPDRKGVVVFGAANNQTVGGLARTATILSHYYKATPMSARVLRRDTPVPKKFFQKEEQEIHSMGYNLETDLIYNDSIPAGIVNAVEFNNAKAVILGYPLIDTLYSFKDTLESVVANVDCPVIVMRFYGDLHTERILVPVTDMVDLKEVFPIVLALDSIGEHQVKILYMMSSTAEGKDIIAKETELTNWLAQNQDSMTISVKAVPTESRIKTIRSSAEEFDLVMMGATRTRGVQKLFFGSLADVVSKNLQKPLMIVYNTHKT